MLIEDESVPVHDGPTRHPLVVFGDHRFCAGERLEVRRMSGPHMHSQVELNYVLDGRITYWFDGRRLQISQGQLCLFWGMIPHQVVEVTEPANFVCLYVPMSVLVNMRSMGSFRDAVFRGGLIEAQSVRPHDREVLLRWRDELLSGDPELEQIVRDELVARIRRIAREGWLDLREQGSAIAVSRNQDPDRLPKVEKMIRFIAEHALGEISAVDVGLAAGLHPNYAMSVFKKTVGLTVNQAITRHRLDTAQSLLISSDLPVAAVAFESGFGSLSRFYEAFEERFSTTPARYRSGFGLVSAKPAPAA
ncbi:helix-turn-helix domain-containing protein [Rhizobium sp. NXC24]|uniref:helix-turn-helix domain-containing protein n=1 Tax=Rhizobium sp. NXC24 TaxID=2048897 RepID=UPI000CDF2E4F|nr:helix-turn-helix domain-containing protein [Rhizobium sp. NXC24]AVA24633.1 transcriptional regulator protein [Rhizobium sp. NXC24]